MFCNVLICLICFIKVGDSSIQISLVTFGDPAVEVGCRKVGIEVNRFGVVNDGSI